MPINSPNIFNSVGDATVTGGSGVGTVTEVDAGTGLATLPASGIVTTGSIKIDDTGVSAGTYKINSAGAITVNAQGQITSATQGEPIYVSQTAVPDASDTKYDDQPVTLAPAVSGKVFIPSAIYVFGVGGSSAETTAQGMTFGYDVANNYQQPCFMTAKGTMQSVGNTVVRSFTASPYANIMTATAVNEPFQAYSGMLGTAFDGNWTAKIVCVGIYHTLT